MAAKNLNERFWEKVSVGKTSECWNWMATKDRKGYGKFFYEGSSDRSHRVAYELHYGIKPGVNCVMHKCDNPSCNNPNHLSLGSLTDNDKDRDAKGRNAKGSSHGMAKLTEGQVIKIKQLLKVGVLQKEIAKLFHVSLATIYNISSGKRWKCV